MKSNKQRREEIRARRRARTDLLSTEYAERGMKAMQTGRLVPGMALADCEILRRYNNGYDMPLYYLDRTYNCRDCGEQCIWTAKQQKWWYEKVHGPIDSQAVRCLSCRRARRAQIAESMAHEGANLLREQTDRLRALGNARPTAEARAEVEAALQSKWWSLRVIAIETMGRWGLPEHLAQLEAFVAARTNLKYYGTWEHMAADAASKALRLRPHGGA
jgi:hypothetical protein